MKGKACVWLQPPQSSAGCDAGRPAGLPFLRYLGLRWYTKYIQNPFSKRQII